MAIASKIKDEQVVIIDELADLMMVVGKKVEELITRLATSSTLMPISTTSA